MVAPMLTPTAPVAQPLQSMWDRHYEIARRLLIGDLPADICRDMNITPGRMSIIRHSPIFVEHMNRLQAKCDSKAVEVAERIQRCAPNSMKVLEDIVADTVEAATKYDPRLRAKVAMDNLDRAGYGAVQKSVQAIMTPEDIDKLKLRRATVVNP